MKNNSLKIGIPSMLMLLFSLCLIIFSVLSFVSAYSDLKVTNKLIARTTSYYEQCNQIQEDLLNISSPTTQLYPIDEKQAIKVEIVQEKNSFFIQSWELISLQDETLDEHLNVFQ